MSFCTKMSNDSFSIIYFCMSGEMIYIIQQRLLSQIIDVDKSDKGQWLSVIIETLLIDSQYLVLNDILNAVYNQGIVFDIFKNKHLLNIDLVKQIFQKLAHSSIMKLNEQSMGKVSVNNIIKIIL